MRQRDFLTYCRVKDMSARYDGMIPEEERLKETAREYVEKHLPQTEERIGIPMDPACVLSLVIPAYGEREHVFRLLASLAEQRGTSPEEFEAIVVVNNPTHAPTRLENEPETVYRSRCEHFLRARQDNQETLSILAHITTGAASSDLSDDEREAIDLLKEHGVKVHIVDKASDGKTLPEEVANVGGARNRGTAEAIERFLEIDRNGIVAHTDADTRLDPDYLRNLIDAYTRRPDAIGVTGEVIMEHDKDALDDELFRLKHLQRLYKKLILAYHHALFHQRSRPHESFEMQAKTVGPSMSARAYQTALADGIPTVGKGEDTRFGERLSSCGKVIFEPSAVVYPLLRVSSRAEGGSGIGVIKLREKNKEGGQLITVENPVLADVFERRITDLTTALQHVFETQGWTPEGVGVIFEHLLTVDGRKVYSEEKLQHFVSRLVKNDPQEVLASFDRFWVVKAVRRMTRPPLHQAIPDLLEKTKSMPLLMENEYTRTLIDSLEREAGKPGDT